MARPGIPSHVQLAQTFAFYKRNDGVLDEKEKAALVDGLDIALETAVWTPGRPPEESEYGEPVALHDGSQLFEVDGSLYVYNSDPESSRFRWSKLVDGSEPVAH
jgi:hypothetical protein